VSVGEHLESRVQLLEDHRDILDTIHRYVRAIDAGDAETWADCFVHDGEYESAFPWSPEHRRLVGREALLAFAASHHDPGEYFAHVVYAPVIDVNDDVATVASHAGRMGCPEGEPVVDAVGFYRDCLVRCADGRWRFAHRLTDLTVLHRSFAASVTTTAE
jgi:ketosteroid isomerase-like protein